MKTVSTTGIPYRPDIDGLRALAAFGVLLFHLGLEWIPGGYVGVDVFFVISGFVITKSISEKINNSNKFRLRSFFIARVIRLVPAVGVTCFLSGVAALFIFSPTDLKNFAFEQVSVATYVANIYYLFEIDYFSGPTKYRALLHTWSLGVEEQFYLLFPLLILFCTKQKISILKTFIVLGGASLLLCWGLSQSSRTQEASFYLVPARAWEFLLGGALYLYIASRSGVRFKESKYIDAALAALGVFGVGYSYLVFTKSLNYPGAYALIPAVSTAFIIYGSASECVCQRLLASKWPVYFGKISYAIYLVHWPAIVFTRYALGDSAIDLYWAPILVLIICLASILHHFVEKPIRQNYNTGAAKASAIISLSFILYSFFFMVLVDQLDFTSRWRAERLAVAIPKNEICQKQDAKLGCLVGAGNEKFIVIGDSHAYGFAAALNAASGSAVKLFAKPGCVPVPGVETKYREDCSDYFDRVFRNISALESDLPIILVARWPYYLSGFAYERRPVVIENGNNYSAILDGLGRISAMSFGEKLLVVGGSPEFNFYPSHENYVDIVFGSSKKLSKAKNNIYDKEINFISEIARNGISFFSLREAFCAGRAGCELRNKNGDVLFYDDNHLSVAGVEQVATYLRSKKFTQLFGSSNNDRSTTKDH